MKAIPETGVVALVATLSITGPAAAGQADVLNVAARCDSSRICSFEVTVRHADTGWDHYADRWDVLTPSGDVLGTRVLYHPHENEQPFTRGLSGVAVPAGVSKVRVRAHDSVHGYGGTEFAIELP